MPSWDSAIRAIFSTFLPAKFAYTGRLDFQDITEDGFYVMSRPCHFFLPIEEYLDNLICPLHPIYVANFELSSVRDEMELIVESTSLESVHSELKSPNQIGVTDGKEPKVSMQKYMRGADRNSGEVLKQTESLITYPSVEYDESSNIRNEMQLSHRFAQFLPDPYLTGYLENLKKRIEIDEMECRDYNWFYIHPKLIRDKIRIIATVVAEEMSGFEPNPYCTQHYKNKFINEMKFQLGTTIFPLGYVRVGDYLERAMLFKVLADRIGFPCAMVRGSHGRAWIEIALPVVNVEEPGEEPNKCDTRVTISQMDRSSGKISSSFVKNHHAISNIGDENFWYPKLQMECFKAFPKHFLKPNAVVDLIDEPGRIFKMNTREADEYCGLLLFSQN
ncbi:hypothetical protein RUM43_005123 [Polyplax serrata]|uniref:EDR1/CTR1/ARMC3-like peptidase-like domain-containing protein n=1 Tax=Polyplax serrata TaxID=468196 RepID=A0AAN8XM86_POLSC